MCAGDSESALIQKSDNRIPSSLIQKHKRHLLECLLCLAERKGFPPALGQCRRQPGVLKNHSLDGFSPASERAAPFESLPLFIPKTKQTPLWVSVLFGGEKGIRTLEYIPALHDFQSCAFDQLSHLSIVEKYVSILFARIADLNIIQQHGGKCKHFLLNFTIWPDNIPGREGSVLPGPAFVIMPLSIRPCPAPSAAPLRPCRRGWPQGRQGQSP